MRDYRAPVGPSAVIFAWVVIILAVAGLAAIVVGLWRWVL